MKYLIVGLGNIGTKYDKTRHNIGFDLVDKIAKDKGVSFELQKLASVAECTHKGKKIILIKPTTYMNLSGKAVRYYQNEHKIPLENILIIVDDLALPIAKLRLKGKGSDAGHNGLKSINESLLTQNYARLKFGIGDDFHKGQQADFVLSIFNTKERIDVELGLDKAMEVVYSFVHAGLQNTMNQFN
jgi:peptidyl-tRNA hydrolase, PTH1 family